MAQTTGSMTCVDYKIELSTDGSNWTDVSGTVQKVTPSGRERATSETHTAGADTPIVHGGKLSAQLITVDLLYTETGGEAFLLLDGYHTAATPIAWRCSPRGGQTGEKTFTTGLGPIQKLDRPPADFSASANPIMVQCVSLHPTTTTATAS